MRSALVTAVMASCLALWAGESDAAVNRIFKMVPASVACLPNSVGRVTVATRGGLQYMHVEVSGLPANTPFDFFVTQVPQAPFGLSWYQGDITTDVNGLGVGDFVGVFSIETFNVAPGVAPAPVTFPTSAAANPATPPVQMYHLGLWFDSPADAVAAGCPATITPFNGPHDAGVQVLNTSNFPILKGPLRSVP